MLIGNVMIDGFAVMAPMAGVADKAVRTLAREQGAAYTVSEMVSAKGVAMGNRKSAELLRPDEAHPYAVQLFGGEPSSMREAAVQAAQLSPDLIDINMGCPAPKITGGGAGSSLLKDLDLAVRVIEAVVQGAGSIPVTVKIRKGFEPGENIAAEAALRFEAAGVSAIAVHGRTRAQMYAPPVDLDSIAQVKRAVSIPVIGNGDIVTEQDAKAMFERTGCDLVMVGRGALGNPWVFARINALMRGEAPPPLPTLPEKLAMLKREILLLIQDKGEYTGIRESRKHASWYMTGLKGAAGLRKLCGEIACIADIDKLCDLAQEQNLL